MRTKKDNSLEARNIRSTYAGGFRTHNIFDRNSKPVYDPRYVRANPNKWAPHPPVSDVIPQRTTNPVFPKIPKGAKILYARRIVR